MPPPARKCGLQQQRHCAASWRHDAATAAARTRFFASQNKTAPNSSIIEDGGDGGACALDGDELAYPCVPCTSTASPRPRARRKMQQALELPNEVRWRLVSRSLRRMRWQQCHIVSPRYPLYFTAAIHRHRLPPLRTPGHHRHLASACRCRHPEQAVPVPKPSPTAVRRTCQNPTLIILPCACRPANRWRCSGTSACRSNELCLESWETTCCATVTGYAQANRARPTLCLPLCSRTLAAASARQPMTPYP